MLFRPLLYMRKKNLLGPFFGKHHGVGTAAHPLSRSKGLQALSALRGWLGESVCNLPNCQDAGSSQWLGDIYARFLNVGREGELIKGDLTDSGHRWVNPYSSYTGDGWYTDEGTGKNYVAGGGGVVDISELLRQPVRIEASMNCLYSLKTALRVCGIVIRQDQRAAGFTDCFYCYLTYQGNTGTASVTISELDNAVLLPGLSRATSGAVALAAGGIGEFEFVVEDDGSTITVTCDADPLLTCSYLSSKYNDYTTHKYAGFAFAVSAYNNQLKELRIYGDY